MPVQVAAALGAGDRKTAERIAHTLKGVASTIGAVRVSEHAAALETAIGAGEPEEDIADILAGLDAELVPIITQLAAALTATGAPTPTSRELGRGQVPEILGRLADVLAEEDSEAVDVWEAHSQLLKEALGAQYGVIQTAIADFDFETALAALRAATGSSQLAH